MLPSYKNLNVNEKTGIKAPSILYLIDLELASIFTGSLLPLSELSVNGDRNSRLSGVMNDEFVGGKN